MSPLPRSRQRADEFAALVDRADRVVRPVADRTDGAAGQRVEQLVGVAVALRRAGASEEQQARTTPREEFVADLRERLVAEAAVVLRPENAALRLPERRRGARERRLVAVASVAVLLGGTAGVAAAAQHALPGDALYPLKRGIEQAQTSLSPNDAAKGRDLLGAATDRLDEVEGLLAQRSATGAPQVPATLATFSQQAREGSDLLLDSYRTDRDPASVAAVRQFAADGLDELRSVSATAPPGAGEELSDAAATLRSIDREASALCSTCSDLPPLRVPRLLLASADAERALATLDRSGAVAQLDNSHPVVVPKEALHRVATLKSAGGATESSGGSSRAGSAGSTGSAGGAGSASGGTEVPSVPAPTTGSDSPPKVEVKVGDKKVDANLGSLDVDKTVETLLPDPQLP